MQSNLAIQDVITVSLLSPSISGNDLTGGKEYNFLGSQLIFCYIILRFYKSLYNTNNNIQQSEFKKNIQGSPSK